MDEATGFGRVESIFEEALGLDIHQRATLLDDRCAGDADLRRQVESLLDHASEPDGFLESPPTLGAIAQGPGLVGVRLGAYRVESEIASGGMGTVYLARRDDDEFDQRVAVKVMKRGLALPGAEARFRAERRLLARLDHPRIARLLDGGTTEDGRPYLVMEYVEGARLDRACAGLSLPARLDLFEKIADAVAFAHARLVVHRDLKPSNILVTPDGEPRLLDFGVAKVLEADDLTITGERPLTPQYASPEQVRGEPITTAADVYALGMLLYEMLTGRRAYDLRSSTPEDSTRMICETLPSPPSAVAADAPTRHRLKGDLDRIVLKALAKNPADRYDSANQLAEDIARWRRGEPVLAGPDTPWYRATKTLSRHKVPAFAGGVAALALVVGFSAAVVGYAGQASARTAEREQRLAAEQAEAVAHEQRRVAEQVGAFMDDMLKSIDPNSARDRDTTIVREVLDRAASRLAESDDMIPSVRTPLEVRVGSSYVAIGELDAGRDHLRRAIDALEQRGEGDSLDAAEAWHWLGRAAYLAGEHETGRRHVERALEIRRASLPEGSVEIAQSLAMLGAIQLDMGDVDGAAASIEESLPIWRRTEGSRAEQVLSDTAKLAGVLLHKGETERAAELLANAAALTDESRVSPVGAGIVNMRAVVARRLGNLEEAERHSNDAIDVTTRLYGPEHPHTLTTRANHAVLLESMGKLDEAAETHERVLAVHLDIHDPEHPDVVSVYSNLTLLRSKMGDHDAAIEAGERAVRSGLAGLGDAHPTTLIARAGLGVALMNSGDPSRYAEAETHLTAAHEGFVQVFGDDHGSVRRTREHLAELYGSERLNDAARLAAIVGEDQD